MNNGPKDFKLDIYVQKLKTIKNLKDLIWFLFRQLECPNTSNRGITIRWYKLSECQKVEDVDASYFFYADNLCYKVFVVNCPRSHFHVSATA